MALFTAYCDETGSAKDINQRFVGMAGFVAPAERWEVLERKWKTTLNEFKVPYFHMKEYAHSEGVFRGWKGREQKRRRIFGALISIIEEVAPFPIGCIFSADDFRNLPERDRKLVDDPYYLSFIACVGIPLHFLQNAPPEVKLATVFGEHSVFASKAKGFHRRIKELYQAGDRLYAPEFRDMRERVPLQAADLIAYELYKEAERQRFRPDAISRYGIIRISKMRERVTNANTMLIPNREHLETMISDAKKLRGAFLTGARIPASSLRLR